MNIHFNNALKYLWITIILCSVFFLLYPSYLPMIDLAQHAAQVSTLDDLLKQQSPWQDMLFIQWDTPYLLSYLFWLGLYQIFSITWSAKILVILIFLFYCYSIREVRKAFHKDYLFDLIAISCFFGFSFQWGFVAYLSAIPVGFLFLLANKKWIETHQPKFLAQITLFGILGYYSHILPYAFFCFLSYSYFLSTFKQHTHQQKLLFTLPYLLFAGMLIRYLLMPDPAPLQNYFPQEIVQDSFIMKSYLLLYAPWNVIEDPYYDLLSIVIYLSPILLGYHFSKKNNAYILLIGALLIFYLMPKTLFNTFFLYVRFALFIPIFYYLVWSKPEKPLSTFRENLAQITQVFLLISISAMMLRNYQNHYHFKHSIDLQEGLSIMQEMEEGKRVLRLFEEYGETMEYRHFLHQWYQAEKHGWADYSFAATHAMIVRLKANALYPNYGNNHLINEINLSHLNCILYDYLLMRFSNPDNLTETIQILQSNPLCSSMQLDAQKGYWLLMRKDKL